MTDFDDGFWSIGSELRAVGITQDGRLLAIKEIENVRGMTLTGLIVSVHHRAWFKENEETLRETFSMNYGKGTIMIFADETSVMEVF